MKQSLEEHLLDLAFTPNERRQIIESGTVTAKRIEDWYIECDEWASQQDRPHSALAGVVKKLIFKVSGVKKDPETRGIATVGELLRQARLR